MIRALIVVMLALATTASAQGPAPGYDDGISYTTAYVQGQAGEAAQDPIGYAEGKGSSQAIGSEARHGLYMACWNVDDAVGDPTGVCDAYYTPPEEAGPEPPVQEGEEAVARVEEDVEELAEETVETVDRIVADPANATDHASGFAEAVAAWAKTFLRGLGQAVDAIAGAIAATVVAVVDGVAIAGQAVGAGTLDGVGMSQQVLGDVLGFQARTSLDALEDGQAEIRDAAVVAWDGASDATAQAGGAIAEAASSIGEAVSDAASWVGQAVTSLFGGHQAEDPGQPTAVPVQDLPVQDDDLLDVLKIVEVA